MSRRHLLKDIFNMTYQDLEDLYRKLGTMKLVAEKLGVTDRTVRNWVKEGKIKALKHPTYNREKVSKMRQWINEHPEEKLPRNLLEITRITGFSKSVVYHYFYRRRDKALGHLQSMGDLRTTGKVLRATDNSYVPVKGIRDYALKVDKFNLRVLVYGERLTGGIFKVFMSMKQYKNLFTAPATVSPTPRPSGQERP